MVQDKQLEFRALGALVEQPETFKIQTQEGEELDLKLYPLQLGRLAMISQRLLSLDLVFDGSEDDVQQMWRVCSEKTREVAEIVAIATLRTKAEIEKQFEERVEELLWSPSMTVSAYVNLILHIVGQSYFADFMHAIRSVRMLRVTIAKETNAERVASMEGRPSGAK